MLRLSARLLHDVERILERELLVRTDPVKQGNRRKERFKIKIVERVGEFPQEFPYRRFVRMGKTAPWRQRSAPLRLAEAECFRGSPLLL